MDQYDLATLHYFGEVIQHSLLEFVVAGQDKKARSTAVGNSPADLNCSAPTSTADHLINQDNRFKLSTSFGLAPAIRAERARMPRRIAANGVSITEARTSATFNPATTREKTAMAGKTTGE